MNAVEIYKGKEYKIELSHLVMTIWLFDEKRLQKHFLYSNQKMGKVAQALKSDDAHIVEQNNRNLANYINNQLHEYLQIALPKKVSFLPQLNEQSKKEQIKTAKL